MLAVGDGHRIAWSVNGPDDATPVVLLHGGPGTGANEGMHGVFIDPLFGERRFRSVIFDQRGCGASTPTGSVEANTTDHLIADMERLRERLGVERWMVAGGSWGTTLALRYAVTHPERCRAVLLRAVTIWSDAKFAWALEGRREVDAKAWHALTALAGRSDWRGILEAFHRAVFGPGRDRAIEAARTWVAYENSYLAAAPADFEALYRNIDPEAAMVKARICLHYWKHRAFLPESSGADGLFAGVERLGDMPVAIVHGGSDHICHPDFLGAWRSALPQARIRMVPGAGHSLEDPPLKQAFRTIIAEVTAAIS